MMEKLIAAFPENMVEALKIASDFQVTPTRKAIHNVVICGMGGSGIGGRMVAGWVADEISVPVHVVHDYFLPAFVNEHTLVIGSSYSGNTEETLASIQSAIERKAHIIGICSGGELEKMCRANDFDVILVPGGSPPRTALAYSITQILKVLSALGLVSHDRLSQLKTARELLLTEETEIKRKAMELARFLKGKVGILYGTTAFEPVLVRARQQFNENSKLLCWHHVIPEMNHNELVGWGGGDERFATVFFGAPDEYKRNARRLEITKEVVKRKSGTYLELVTKGESLIERSMYLINVVDWASLYLSELNGVDPVDIEIIDYLKNELANFQ